VNSPSNTHHRQLTDKTAGCSSLRSIVSTIFTVTVAECLTRGVT